MRRFCIVLGVLAVIFQNMVFWQALLPKKMQQNEVCVQIMHVMDYTNMPSQHHISSEKSTIDRSIKTDNKMDCHFCQLFHSSLPISFSSPKVIESKLLVKLIFLTILAYIFFYLQRLFLSPQGRGPPLIPVFA
ncbi:DUF2946 domain-containing protein [Acinetobacter puyangensis]|nr:DUF2946 domain-containing protein [Acinetobacter puyangensis]